MPFRLFSLFAVLIITPSLLAQHGPPPQQLKAIQAFQHMVGTWEGTGWIQMGPQKSQFRQIEDVQFQAGKTIIAIHGRGYNQPEKPDEGPVFEAFGILSYDARAQKYHMQAYKNDGQQVAAWFQQTEKGFDWGFESGPVKIKYIAELTENTWRETGYITMPHSETPQLFF